MNAMKPGVIKTGIVALLLCSCLGCNTVFKDPPFPNTRPALSENDWHPKSKEEARFWIWVYYLAKLAAR
jgi:hypothetical protein